MAGPLGQHMRGTHGWAEITADDKRAIIEAVAEGKATPGPFHIELDLTDRCNVDCYFCNQMDVRTKEQIPYPRICEILDEMTPRGLRSVRLSGGGDPLFHREIAQVIDAIHERGLVIDNITTNGLGLTPAIAQKLVDHRTREVVNIGRSNVPRVIADPVIAPTRSPGSTLGING